MGKDWKKPEYGAPIVSEGAIEEMTKTKELLESKTERLKVQMESMLPNHMHQAVIDWLWNGWIPGSFLTSVLENNLKRAAMNADTHNSIALSNWAKFFTWYMPMDCWGNKENVVDWHKMGGWNGMLKRDAGTEVEPWDETK